MATYTDAEVIKVMLRAAERFPRKGVANCNSEAEARGDLAQHYNQREYIRQQLPGLEDKQLDRCSEIIDSLEDDGSDEEE